MSLTTLQTTGLRMLEHELTDTVDSEKLLKMDAKRREYDIVVVGEESHLAYNRVGLTSFFQHRKAENLYLNPREWVRWKLNSLVSLLG